MRQEESYVQEVLEKAGQGAEAMKLISVQSRGNRIATIEQNIFTSQITGKIKKPCYLRLKEIKWKGGFYGPFIERMSQTNKRIALELAAKWLEGATV